MGPAVLEAGSSLNLGVWGRCCVAVAMETELPTHCWGGRLLTRGSIQSGAVWSSLFLRQAVGRAVLQGGWGDAHERGPPKSLCWLWGWDVRLSPRPWDLES